MLASRQPIVASVRRDAWVEVDLGALEFNMLAVKSWLNPATKVMAVVKSDAYGHGAVGVAEVLIASGADWLGVASVDEGCQLREAGVKAPILLLGPCPAWALTPALEANLQLTITMSDQIRDIAEAASRLGRTAGIHLKVDSGMHRLGISPDQVLPSLALLSQHKQLKLAGLFSHLACADNQEVTQRQNSVFQDVVGKVKAAGYKPELLHLASSDATCCFPDTHYDMVRPGLILYGLEAKTVSSVVKPIMSVRGRINHLQELEAGQAVGYNLTWTAARRSRIASIPIGYADGVDRGLSNHLEGLLFGKRVQQVGLISMDQMLFDVSDVAQAQEGDVITLLGCESAHASAAPGFNEHTLYMSTWANQLDTITYELACRLRARMPRIYTRHSVSDR